MSRTRVHPEANGDFSKVAGKAGPAGDQQQNVMPPNPAAFSLARQLTTRLGGGRRRPYSQTSEGSEQASRDGSDRSRPSTISRSLSARCAAFAAAQRSGVGELITPAQRRLGEVKKLARAIITGDSGPISGGSAKWRVPGAHDTSQGGIHRLVIHPHSKLKALFDLFVVMCVLWTIIMVPLQLTVLRDEEPDEFMTALERGLDAIFLFDVVLQFFHGFMEHGFPVLNLYVIARNYLTSWFLVDLLSSVPFSALPVTGPWAAFRLLKVMRLMRIKRLMQRWAKFSAAKVFHVIQTVTGWLIMAHWLACGWYFLGWTVRCSLDLHSDPTSDGHTWVTIYWPALDTPCGEALAPIGSRGVPTAHTRWLRSLYWALATMTSLGYGSGPVAHTDGEFAYSVVCQVLGACCYAAIFGNIAQLIQKLDAAGVRYQEQIEKVNEFIRFHRLPTYLAHKLHAYAEFLFEVNRGLNVSEIAEAMPNNLQEEVFLHLHEHLVRQAP